MATRNRMMEFLGGAVSQSLQQDGVVRLKILVKRQQLEQVLGQVVKKHDNNERCHVIRPRSSASKWIQQWLKDMKRIQILRSHQVKRDFRTYWRPILRSIPESRVLVI